MPPNDITDYRQAVTDEALRRIREQAWDEGYAAGVAMKPFDSRTHQTNPYRKAR